MIIAVIGPQTRGRRAIRLINRRSEMGRSAVIDLQNCQDSGTQGPFIDLAYIAGEDRDHHD